MTTLADSNDRCQSFHKLTFEECKRLYKINLIDTAVYILFIVKCHGAAGWKWSFKVKDFCKEWNIKERAFYRGVAKLKEHNLLHWEVRGTITVWHGSDIAKEPDRNNISNEYKYPVTYDSDGDVMSINTLSPVTVHMSPVTGDMSFVTQETLEKPTIQGVQNSPDYIQTSTDSSESVEEESSGDRAQDSAIEKPILKIKDVPEEPLTPSTINPDLQMHLEDAAQGKKPSEEITEQLLEHQGYAPALKQYAKEYGWDLSQWYQSKISPEVQEQMRLLREKVLSKKFKLSEQLSSSTREGLCPIPQDSLPRTSC